MLTTLKSMFDIMTSSNIGRVFTVLFKILAKKVLKNSTLDQISQGNNYVETNVETKVQ